MRFHEALQHAMTLTNAIIYPVGERVNHAYHVKDGKIRLVGQYTYAIPIRDFLDREWVAEEEES